MKAKSIILTVLAFMVSVAALTAQPGGRGDKKERVKAFKVGYITNQIGLTTVEAEKFWPVYNAHVEQMEALRKEHNELRKKYRGKSPDQLSEAEAQEIVDGEMAFREKKLAIEKQYNEDLKSVLPIQKVLKYYKAERDFKRKLLKKMKGRRGGRRGPGPRGPGGPDGPPHGMDDSMDE